MLCSSTTYKEVLVLLWLFLQPFLPWLLPYVEGILQSTMQQSERAASPGMHLHDTSVTGTDVCSTSDDFWQIIGSGSKLTRKDPRNVIFGSSLSHQVTAWALEQMQRKEKTLGAKGSLLEAAWLDWLKFISPQQSDGFMKVRNRKTWQSREKKS